MIAKTIHMNSSPHPFHSVKHPLTAGKPDRSGALRYRDGPLRPMKGSKIASSRSATGHPFSDEVGTSLPHSVKS